MMVDTGKKGIMHAAEAVRLVRTRPDSARFAIASTVMEGLTVSLETEQLLAEWSECSLTDDELMAAVLK
jgi:hypothetical protein